MSGITTSMEAHRFDDAEIKTTIRPARGRFLATWDWVLLTLTVVLAGLGAAPMIHCWSSIPGDYAVHSFFGEHMKQTARPGAPHFAYHAFLAATQTVTEWFGNKPGEYDAQTLCAFVGTPTNYQGLAALGLHYTLSATIACTIFAMLLAAIVWLAIRRTVAAIGWGQGWTGRIVTTLLTFGMLLIGPLSLLAARDNRMYLGYIGLNVWHSPTMLMLKPLAVLSFFYAIALFKDPPALGEAPAKRPGLLWTTLFIAAGALITVLSTLAKPNYTLCLLPGVAMFIPWAWYKRMTIRWVPLMLGLVLPALIVLAWQYSFKYQGGGGETKNSIIFAPLLSVSKISPKYIYWKLLLSIIFPAVVWLLFLRGVFADRRMVLAWLVFDCGVLWRYLFSESARPAHGNFSWGAQMALFILFLESVRFLLRSGVPGTRLTPAGHVSVVRPAMWAPVAICTLVFLAHVAFGMAYNLRVLQVAFVGEMPGWWW